MTYLVVFMIGNLFGIGVFMLGSKIKEKELEETIRSTANFLETMIDVDMNVKRK